MKILTKLLPVIIIASACSKDVPPPAPGQLNHPQAFITYPFLGDTAHADSPWPYSLIFEDNSGLDSVEVIVGKKPLGGAPYYYLKQKVEGTEISLREEDVRIPKNQGLTGEHYLYVRCTDIDGNETSKVLRSFYYTDQDIMKPKAFGRSEGLFYSDSNPQVKTYVSAMDHRNLMSVSIALVDSTFNVLYVKQFNPDSASFHNSHYFSKPPELKQNDIYRFQFSATDSAGNRGKANGPWFRVQ